MNAIHYLRVNVKSLAAEARFIRAEMSKTRDPSVRESLSHHRKTRLKDDARLAHLALTFVRGKPYRRAEASTHRPVDSFALSKKINRFLQWDERVTQSEVANWLLAKEKPV